ncbi:hypothetical protein [Runella zeae]|uniref:hypothetical protein n=1 Tax=Runella zeae TaxID=94255 RepID=UPI002351FE04|nr:hypothetical protein [Runella zeae]
MKIIKRYSVLLILTIMVAAGIWWYVKKNNLSFKSLFASVGNSPIVVEDYEIKNGKLRLFLSNGSGNIQIELKQNGQVITTQKVTYAAEIDLETSAQGYLDLYIDNTDLATLYIPHTLTGDWKVEKSKSVDENAVMNLAFDKQGEAFTITDLVDNSGWSNVEYWHNQTLIGSSIPTSYLVSPNLDIHLTKKRWGNFDWIGQDGDGKHREMAQLTFKITKA